MISSRYQWRDIAGLFVIESFTRRVKWLVKQPKYAKYDTTASVPGRVQDSFEASKTSRRLVMFQVWFSRSNAIETLQSYNQRLGRPRSELRDGIVAKTKSILKCSSWQQYLQELRVVIRDQDIPEMLRFAVFNSVQMRYHRPRDHRQICRMELPSVKVLGATGNVQLTFKPPISSSTNITNQRPRYLKPRHIPNAPSTRPRAAAAVPQRPTRRPLIHSTPLSAPRSVGSAHSAHSDPRRMPTVRTPSYTEKAIGSDRLRRHPRPAAMPSEDTQSRVVIVDQSACFTPKTTVSPKRVIAPSTVHNSAQSQSPSA